MQTLPTSSIVIGSGVLRNRPRAEALFRLPCKQRIRRLRGILHDMTDKLYDFGGTTLTTARWRLMRDFRYGLLRWVKTHLSPLCVIRAPSHPSSLPSQPCRDLRAAA